MTKKQAIAWVRQHDDEDVLDHEASVSRSGFPATGLSYTEKTKSND